MKEYVDYECWQSVRAAFTNRSVWQGEVIDDVYPENEPDHVYAEYEDHWYAGSAFVAYFVDGKFYEVSGSHCSCHGLEGQWEPEEYEPAIYFAAIERRPDSDHKTKLLQLYREAMAGA